ncbi:MAG: helix-turn-helix transcriptional regulator [Acidimicrobiia bacterium]
MNNHQPTWLSTEDVADRYGVPVGTVRKWRATGTGPTGVRLGRHVRYALTSCEEWEREQVAKQVRASA